MEDIAGGDRDDETVRPEVRIIIVTAAGTREHIERCLDSLERHPFSSSFEVCITDNASNDGTSEAIATDFPWVKLRTLHENVGFPAANNLWLRENRAPFVLLLNPDTIVMEAVLDEALAELKRRSEVGILGCRLVRLDGSLDHAAKRSFPTIAGALGHFSGIGRMSSAPAMLSQYRAPALSEHDSGYVDSVNGAFMLARSDLLRDVGLLDEGYPTPGMDDLDWCFRASQAGWRVWYEGSITVVHVKGASHVTERRRRRYRNARHNLAFHRSMGRFYRRHYGGRGLVDALVYVGIAAKCVVAIARSSLARASAKRHVSHGG